MTWKSFESLELDALDALRHDPRVAWIARLAPGMVWFPAPRELNGFRHHIQRHILIGQTRSGVPIAVRIAAPESDLHEDDEAVMSAMQSAGTVIRTVRCPEDATDVVDLAESLFGIDKLAASASVLLQRIEPGPEEINGLALEDGFDIGPGAFSRAPE